MSGPSSSAETLTALVLQLFRTNNATVVWGDRLVQPYGLTSARWQIMGAIAYADRPRPVAWLARDLGANRQNVQRIVNDLAKEGLVAFEPNPSHRRAQLVVMTPPGRHAYEGALAVWYRAAENLSRTVLQGDLATALRVLETLRQSLLANGTDTKGGTG